MSRVTFEVYDGDEITDSMVQEASRLFSENYGIWSKDAATEMGAFAKAGSHVKLSKNRLREQYLPGNALNFYARITVDGHLVGNGFACRWNTITNQCVGSLS